MKHVTLLKKLMADGHSRVCDYRCYNGNPEGGCQCICGGKFHGVGLEVALALAPEYLDMVRQSIPVADGEHVVLRMFA